MTCPSAEENITHTDTHEHAVRSGSLFLKRHITQWYICIFISIFVCVREKETELCVRVCVCVRVWVGEGVGICVSVCVYVYACIHTYQHKHTHVDIFISLCMYFKQTDTRTHQCTCKHVNTQRTQLHSYHNVQPRLATISRYWRACMVCVYEFVWYIKREQTISPQTWQRQKKREKHSHRQNRGVRADHTWLLPCTIAPTPTRAIHLYHHVRAFNMGVHTACVCVRRGEVETWGKTWSISGNFFESHGGMWRCSRKGV